MDPLVPMNISSYSFRVSGKIHDTNRRALDAAMCDSCTGRFVADRPDKIEKAEEETSASIRSPERIARQGAHFKWKRIFDEKDYPCSLIPLIERWAPGRRVLDLGCSASRFLPLLMRRGFDTVGLECDLAHAQVARENGVTIVSGDWRKISEIVGTDSFDCIVSDQVFELILDPVNTLRALRPVLGKGGILIFQFPNEGSLRRKARRRGNKCPLSCLVDHWNYFNERAAATCFKSAEYEVLQIKKDPSLHGFLVRKVFPALAFFPGMQQLVARTIMAIDNNALSNGLTVVSRPS